MAVPIFREREIIAPNPNPANRQSPAILNIRFCTSVGPLSVKRWTETGRRTIPDSRTPSSLFCFMRCHKPMAPGNNQIHVYSKIVRLIVIKLAELDSVDVCVFKNDKRFSNCHTQYPATKVDKITSV